MIIPKKWLTAGVILGGVVSVLGRWDWGVACFVFCLAASYGQFKIDNMESNERLSARVRKYS